MDNVISNISNPLHIVTPLLESSPLSALFGGSAILKMEAFQPVGSFKIRGIGKACQAALQGGATRLVASSGGNAGYAVAYAGRKLGCPVQVFVPKTTSLWMRDLLRSEGAEVVEHGAAWDDAHAHAKEIARVKNAAYIHPFDDPLIWTGHASMIDEVAAIGPKPDAVVLSVGGGGLLCGVLEGLHRVGWKDVPVVAVETQGASSFAASVSAGKLVTLEKISSIATSLGARQVAPQALAWIDRHDIVPFTVTDQAAVTACMRFAKDHRILVEPACGAALAALYERAKPLEGKGTVLVIVCGGAGVNFELLKEWSDKTRQ